jgi:mono/diheme cytochrome c family protein
MKLKSTQTILLSIFALILLATTGWVVIDEFSRPWKDFQEEFKTTEKKLLDDEIKLIETQKIGATGEQLKKLEGQEQQLNQRLKLNAGRSAEIDQIWIPELRRADRCATCHAGVEKAAFAQVEGPLKKHPGDFFAHHPTKTFGCTLCHEGDGMGLSVEEGHGETDHWNRPLLRGETVESSCSKCHLYNEQVPEHVAFPDAPTLTQGKNLYVAKGCRGCHELQGFERPYSIAPVLSRVGEKVDNDWLGKWLKRPKDYLPETIMPFFDLPDEEIQALAAFLLSRKEKSNESVQPLVPGDIESGQKLVAEIGCLGCHKVQEKGGTFGPDLSRVAEKLDFQWQVSWIKDPLAYDPETVMPNFRLADKQLSDIANYLLSLGTKADVKKTAEPISENGQLVETGKKLFSQKGCTGCHTMKGFEMGFKKAPEHTGFGDKRVDELDFGNVHDIPRTRAAWVLAKEKSPRIFSTDTIKLIMPNFELSDEEAQALRTFVLGFTNQSLPSNYIHPLWDTSAPYFAGMRVIEKYNCVGCHKIGLTQKPIKLTEDIADSYLWSAANVALEEISANGETTYEKGQELSDAQYKFLSRNDPEIEASLYRNRWFLDIDTVEYLNLDMGFETLSASGVDEGLIVPNYRDLNFAPPLLNYEGIKVDPNWLFQFLKSPYLIRPLAKATMPTFNLEEGEIKGLVEFFQSRDQIDQNPFFQTPEVKTSEIETAEKIFKVCLQCHYYDQNRTESKDRFGGLKGPNLAEVKRRLRPEYIKKWIKYPDLIIPGTQMKNFFYYFDMYERFEELETDETGFPEIPPDEKIDLMARFLMNPLKGKTIGH